MRMSTAVWESCLLHFAHYVPVQLTAVYLRVSGANTQKFDRQEDELKRCAELHKPQIIKWYRDKFTGNTMDRPGMQKLMLDLQEGKLKSIVSWRLDRLGRNAAGLTRLSPFSRVFSLCVLILVLLQYGQLALHLLVTNPAVLTPLLILVNKLHGSSIKLFRYFIFSQLFYFLEMETRKDVYHKV